ncbi:MAG: DinB family protein [Pirellulales bacterium]|nr:DinB family protein [Pirellulales bacterium]
MVRTAALHAQRSDLPLGPAAEAIGSRRCLLSCHPWNLHLVMDPAIAPWVELWDYLDGNFWGVWQWAQRSLRPEQVAWQPLPQVASIGWNLQHLGEMLDHYLAHVFHVQPQVQETPLYTMRPGAQDDGRHRDLDALGAYHRRVRADYRRFLAGLRLADLARPLGQGRHRRSWAWAVGHIAEHESYHVGKCMLLRTLLAAR